jgi:hypothetical protein
MPVVRSQHLGHASNSSLDPVLVFTAPDDGVTVIKGWAISSITNEDTENPFAYVYVEFSGGVEVAIIGIASYGELSWASEEGWIVLPAGTSVYLVGDGVNEYSCTVDGAILAY